MKLFTDQLGIEHTFSTSPKRIISLVPSQTELLYDLGLEDDRGSGAYALPRASAFPQEFMLSSRPTSKKERQKEAEAAAAAVIAAAEAEKVAQAESDRLYKEYMKLERQKVNSNDK